MKKAFLAVGMVVLAGCGAVGGQGDCLAALDAADEIFAAQTEVTRADTAVLESVAPAVIVGSKSDIDRLARDIEGVSEAVRNLIDTIDRVGYEDKAARCRA